MKIWPGMEVDLHQRKRVTPLAKPVFWGCECRKNWFAKGIPGRLTGQNIVFRSLSYHVLRAVLKLHDVGSDCSNVNLHVYFIKRQLITALHSLKCCKGSLPCCLTLFQIGIWSSVFYRSKLTKPRGGRVDFFLAGFQSNSYKWLLVRYIHGWIRNKPKGK